MGCGASTGRSDAEMQEEAAERQRQEAAAAADQAQQEAAAAAELKRAQEEAAAERKRLQEEMIVTIQPVMQRLLEDIQKSDPRSPALGLPSIPLASSAEGGKGLDDLPDQLADLHYGMPPDIKAAPMRLLHIDAVLGWPNIRVFEEVPSSDYREVAYEQVDDATWAQVAVLSWRWAAGKPATLQPGYSPMSERQFQELQALLRLGKEEKGLSYVWVDWCCVPQYESSPMVEVLRSKVFYARARAMIILPAFQPLPPDGPVRLILSKAQRALRKRASEESNALSAVTAAVLEGLVAKDQVATREYFGRVWTMAERMARYGRGEKLCHWLTLEAWLGMVVDAMLRSTEDATASVIYKRMLGPDVSALLDAVLAPLSAAVRTGSTFVAEGLELQVARLCELSALEWHVSRALEEGPTKAWLHTYLTTDASSGIYSAFNESDRVWAVYSYFSWKKPDQASTEGLKEALAALMEVAGGERKAYQQGMAKQLKLFMSPAAYNAASWEMLDAAEEGDLAKMRELLDWGVALDVQRSETDGWNALKCAAAADQPEIIAELARRGFPLESKDLSGLTALYTATQLDRAKAVKALIQAGARTECKDETGMTPLEVAVRMGYLEIVKALIAGGANLNNKNSFDVTLLELASEADGDKEELERILRAAGAR